LKDGRCIIFVYGTLMSGNGNNYLMDKCKLIGPAKVPGDLYASGVPFARFNRMAKHEESDAELPHIEGELWDIDELALARLDRLESYRPGKPSLPNWYDRIQIDEIDGVPVYMYHVEEPPAYAEHVPSGSYRQYRNSQLPKAAHHGS
jgi:gamma-glutamylcyclotransferase (GGCT)/AIG2-like uncharacterized protein YtfP